MLPQTFQVSAQCGQGNGQSTTLIILRCIIPIHTSSQQVLSSQLVYSPLSLFLTQQSVLSSISRANFARDSQKEFFNVFESTMSVSEQAQRRCRVFSRNSRVNRNSWIERWSFANSMEEGKINHGFGHDVAIDAGREQLQLTPPPSDIFPGIVVRKSVTVTVSDKRVDEQENHAVLGESSSENESRMSPKRNDDAIWADICFKGIANRQSERPRSS